MSPLPLTGLALSVTLKEVLRALIDHVDEDAPSVTDAGDGLTIAKPDRRLTAGIFFPEGQPRPAIFLEKEGSWARDQAEAIADELSATVDIVVRGSAQSSWPKERVPARSIGPLRPGDSVSHFAGRAGTLGCLVTQSTPRGGLPGFVGAAHVLSLMNKANAGAKRQEHDDIIRPGVPDGPKAHESRVGYLRNFVYLNQYQEPIESAISTNTEDVALVLTYDGIECEGVNLVPNPQQPNELKRISGVVAWEDLLTYTGRDVYKVGRTTELTRGKFSGIEAQDFPMKLPDKRIYLYSNVIQVARTSRSPFSKAGDSGALVYTDDFKGLGLVIGGNDQFSWVSPLAPCLSQVGASLLT